MLYLSSKSAKYDFHQLKIYAELVEWSNTAVLKTAEVNSLLGFESLALRQVSLLTHFLFR